MRKIIKGALFVLLFAPLAFSQSQVVNGSRTYPSGSSTRVLVANDSGTGTTVNLLAKLTSTGAIKATIADTTLPSFIVEAGAGTTGNAEIVAAGTGNCVMDTTASNTEGFYVIESTTTDGRCHAQSSPPTAWIVGTLVSNSTTSGSTAIVHSLNTFNISGAGSGTVTSIATTAPIGGGTITTTGTITCATCVTSTSALTDLSPVIGSGGGQGSKTVAGITSDGTSVIGLGVAGTSVGGWDLKNATSGTLSVRPPTGALGTITNSLQAVTDTFVYKATTDTLTNKTADAEGTGNVYTRPFYVSFSPGCNNATAGPGSFNVPTASAATFSCSGTTATEGNADFVDAATTGLTTQGIRLPDGWVGTVDISVVWYANAASANAVRWQVSTGCVADTEAVNTGPTFNTASATNSAYTGTALQRKTTSQTAVAVTNCSAGESIFFKVERVGGDAGDTLTATAELIELQVKGRTTK